MKKAIRSTLTAALVPLTVLSVGFSFTTAVTAKPKAKAVQPPRICTPESCTPYRAHYEKAISTGIISRPASTVDQYQALRLGDQAFHTGNLNEAALRYAQALVIISETEGHDKAVSFEQGLDTEFQQGWGETLRQSMPLLGKILPMNANPYDQNLPIVPPNPLQLNANPYGQNLPIVPPNPLQQGG